jgi:DNA-binding CsgD family transcriptional regulator
MPGVRFSELDQRVLHNLLTIEPVPGDPLPGKALFEMLNRLVRCDSLGAVYSDLHGRVTRALHVMPRGADASTLDTSVPAQDRSEHDGPFYLGVMHWREHPAQAEHCGSLGTPGDGLCIGYRNGTDAIVQYYFHREDRLFSDRDLALIHMIKPLLQRLVRKRPTPTLPSTITITERRVLCHVAAGRSNAQIAETLCISVGTVRKHLENAYRKLGVSNRVAAIARLRGSDEPALDLRGRLERYA